MNKRFSWVMITTILVATAPRASHAGSIDYLSNQSADFIRLLARNAATDAVDIVSYNPAGTAFLAEGLYVSLSSQTALKNYEITYDGQTYSATNPTPVLPSLFAAYRKWDFAAFASFTVPAGGGSLSYDDGVPYLIPLRALVDMPAGKGTEFARGKFSGSSMFLAPTVGGSYKFFDMVSVAAAARLVAASKSYEGEATYGDVTATLNAKKKALGVGGIFGVHVRPIKQLDIGLRYETETALEFEASTKSANLAAMDNTPLESYGDGAKEQRNLPGLLGAGIAYHILPSLSAMVAFNYYFIKAADASDDKYTNLASGEKVYEYAKSYNDEYDNGMEIAAAVEYEVMKGLQVSLGYTRAIAGGNAKTYNDFEYVLDSNTVGGGARYTFLDDRLSLTLGIAVAMYDEAKNDSLLSTKQIGALLAQTSTPGTIPFDGVRYEALPETFNKTVVLLALGAQYRFF